MKSILKKNALRLTVVAFATIGASASALAEPDVPPFYAAVMQMKPEGKLGQVISKEKSLRRSKALRPGELPIFPRTSMIARRFRPAFWLLPLAMPRRKGGR